MKAPPARPSRLTSRNRRRKTGINHCSDLGSPALHVGSAASARLSLVPRFPQRGDPHRSVRWCLPDPGFYGMAGDCQSCAISGTLCPGAQRRRRLDSWLSCSRARVSLSALAGASAGFEPIGWLIFSLSYRALCLVFRGLSNWHSTFQIFMLGAVVYLILTTLCWIAATIWRAREAHASHPNHHAS